jgi:hypothetical protein
MGNMVLMSSTRTYATYPTQNEVLRLGALATLSAVILHKKT